MKTKIKYTKELLEPLVKDSISVQEVMRKLNLKPGGNHTKVINKIKKYEIDYSHFKGQGWRKGKEFEADRINFYTNVLKLNGRQWKSARIKKVLLHFNIKEDICEKCGQANEWNSKKLTLQLHHKDGNRQNNELSNLRILCPNCHSQTKTYAGRNIGNGVK